MAVHYTTRMRFHEIHTTIPKFDEYCPEMPRHFSVTQKKRIYLDQYVTILPENAVTCFKQNGSPLLNTDHEIDPTTLKNSANIVFLGRAVA